MSQPSQVVLITGASAGLGKAFTKALLADGYTVYAVARRLEQMHDLAQLGAHTLAMDITDHAQVEAVVDRIRHDHGGVDILINNAGFGMYGAMEDTSIEDARYQFEVNVFGLARLTQLVLPEMRRKRAGKIINISSIVGRIYVPLGSWYIASKHALEGWSDCLRLELAPFNIDVVVIQPGAIKTEFGDVMTAPMLARSGEGPYGDMARTMADMTTKTYATHQSSPPEVIVKLVRKAVRAKKPKTRYAGGKFAGSMLFMRQWVSDRLFDRIVASTVNM